MHLICNCQSGTIEESAGTWMFATSGSAGPCRADKLSKIVFFFLDRERVRRYSGNSNTVEGREGRGISAWNVVDLRILRGEPRGGFTWGLNLFPRGKEGGYGGLAIGSVSCHPRLVAIHFALVAVVMGVQGNFLEWLCLPAMFSDSQCEWLLLVVDFKLFRNIWRQGEDFIILRIVCTYYRNIDIKYVDLGLMLVGMYLYKRIRIW